MENDKAPLVVRLAAACAPQSPGPSGFKSRSIRQHDVTLCTTPTRLASPSKPHAKLIGHGGLGLL
eukprot:scaffold315173_cov36-Tisochrysis_lutea.AAC.2